MTGDKIFYSIAEVSEKTDLPKHVIRFWETEFGEISPDRHQGRRYYRQDDIDVILKIKELLYKKGFTIKGAKKFLHEKKSPTSKVFDDFEMNEEKKSLEPVQNSKILKKFNFLAPEEPVSLSLEDKLDLEETIKKLSEIEKILSEN